jgi:hypothetical protein
MIQPKKRLLNPFSATVNTCLMLLYMAFSQAAQAQCTQLLGYIIGTVQVGCTEVTVTSQGNVDNYDYCGVGPYSLGPGETYTSFTFTFSPPVSGVTIDIAGLTNYNSGTEELSFEVNGVFYPITVPGNIDPCEPPCILLPSGRIGAPSGIIGCSWEAININETISTLKVENEEISGFPGGMVFNIRICESCCATDAGVLSGSPLQVCIPQSASFSPATQTNLEPDDLLQYILFTDLNDTLSSIVATSSTPSFAFAPPLQLNTTYYGAAIAGNEVNGNVDLNDPCLDVSNAIEIEWVPQPSVSFAAANPEVCAGDCLNFDVSFTGTPPFSLTYTAGGGPQTQSFSANAGTLQICPPAGTPLGTTTLAAVSLTDGNCVCE